MAQHSAERNGDMVTLKNLGTATSGCFEVKHGKTNQHELRNRPFQCSKIIQFVSKDLHKKVNEDQDPSIE